MVSNISPMRWERESFILFAVFPSSSCLLPFDTLRVLLPIESTKEGKKALDEPANKHNFLLCWQLFSPPSEKEAFTNRIPTSRAREKTMFERKNNNKENCWRDEHKEKKNILKANFIENLNKRDESRTCWYSSCSRDRRVHTRSHAQPYEGKILGKIPSKRIS